MSDRHRHARDADSGASLIMAIAFVLVVGLISAGLVGLTTSSLNNRTPLQRLRNRQYAADGAVELAISVVRGLTCSPTTTYLADDPAARLNRIPIRVEWVTVCGVVQGGDRGPGANAVALDGTVVAQRNVVFSACESTATGPGVLCDPNKVLVRAAVNFEQTAVGAVTNTFVQSWSVNQ